VYLYDAPANTNFASSTFEETSQRRGISLQYYEGIDDVFFCLFVFKLFTNPNRAAIVLNWGQNNDAQGTHFLFKRILSGEILPPKIQIVPKTDMRTAILAGTRSAVLFKYYETEEDIITAFNEIQAEVRCFP
jgi:hypothetical protein